MTIAFQVITKIDGDNEYDEPGYIDEENILHLGDRVDSEKIQVELLGRVKVQAWHLGEIVIIDKETGREIPYPQRKADKWFVEYELFTTIEDAVKRSVELSDQETEKLLRGGEKHND